MSRYSGTKQRLSDSRRFRERRDRGAEAYQTQQDSNALQAAAIVGKSLVKKREANVLESEALLGIQAKNDVGNIKEGTNLYSDTRSTGANTLKEKFNQGVGNLYKNVTGDYVEQNPEVIKQVKGQATMDLTQEDQMATLYGSTAAKEYMDKFQGERSRISKIDQMPSIGGSDPTMDYSSLEGSGLTPGMYDDLVQHRQYGGVGVKSNFGQTAGNAFQTSTPVRDPNLATSGYQPSYAMLNRMRTDQEALLTSKGLDPTNPLSGEKYENIMYTESQGGVNTFSPKTNLVDGAGDGDIGVGANFGQGKNAFETSAPVRKADLATSTYDPDDEETINIQHEQKIQLADEAYGGDRAAASDEVAASLKNFEFGDEEVQSVDPMNTSIDGSGDYPNYSRNKALTAKKKGDEFYEKFGDDVEFIPGRGPVPKAPIVPVESEDEFFDEDISVGKDPKYNLPGFQAKLQRLIPGGKTGSSPIEALDESYKLPHELTRESIAAGEEVEALNKTMEHDANMKSIIEDMEKGAETYRDNPAQQYRDRMEKIDRKEGTGKYSDPNVPVESDQFRGNEIGAEDVESRDDLAELGVVPEDATLKSTEESINEEVGAIYNPEEKTNKKSMKDITDKITQNTKASQIISGVKNSKELISGVSDVVNEEKTKEEKIESSANILKDTGSKVATKRIEKKATEKTGEMIGDILAKKGADDITNVVAKQASKQAAKEVAKAALSIPASVVTGGLDIASGGEEAGAAGSAGNEMGEAFGKAKQVSGGVSIVGGVVTAVGLLANLVPGVGQAASAYITPIGLSMLKAGSVGSIASAGGQVGSMIAEGKRGSTIGRDYKKKFKDVGDRYV